MIMVPEYLMKCLEPDGFIREVKNRVGPTKKLSQAYEDLESEMMRYFGRRKYSDFSGFQVILHRHNKRKRK